MEVTGIGWAGVLTEDFESSLRFFSNVLGLSLTYHDDTKELAHFRFRSGQLLEIYGPSNRGRKDKYRFFRGPVLGFEVDNIELARQEMIAHGTRFITQLESWEDDRWTMFLGPEGQVFEIMQAARSPASRFESVLGICSARFLVQDFSAIQFFSHGMGMTLNPRVEDQARAHCLLPNGDRFEVSRASTGQRDPTITIGFEVNDMSKARRELESKGLEFIGSPDVQANGNPPSQFCGPDGYIYEIISDLTHEQ